MLKENAILNIGESINDDAKAGNCLHSGSKDIFALDNQINVDEYLYSDPEISDAHEEEEEEVQEQYKQNNLYDKVYIQMLAEEKDIKINPENMISLQTEITPIDRDNAASLIYRMHHKWGISSDITHNALTFLNITLSTKNIQLNELNLTAVVCFCIALKVDIKKRPSTEEISEILGESITREMFSVIEIRIIEALNFKLSYPTVKSFIRRYVQTPELNQSAAFLLDVFVEKAMIGFEYLKYYPSVIAACIVAATYAGFRNYTAVRNVIVDARCDDLEMFKECFEKILNIGLKIKKALKEINRTSDPVVNALESIDFNIDIDSFVN